MAKIFFSLQEALGRLSVDEATLKQFVREGKLREFRDAGKPNYKIEDIEKLVKAGGGKPARKAPAPTSTDDNIDLSGSLGPISLADSGNKMPDMSASGSVGLLDTGLSLSGSAGERTAAGTKVGRSRPAAGDSSGIQLSESSAEDIVRLDEDDTGSAAATTAGKAKDDTVVSSVGISVFDEEDLGESADPMAKTLLTGSAAGGTGLEGVGSGSGLLDLTRESDDTSLGAELLDEIYPAEEPGTAAVEMGDATRAGLEAMAPEEPVAKTKTKARQELEPASREAPARQVVTVTTVEYPADTFSLGVSGLLAAATLVMCFAGLAAASMIRGVWPSLLQFVYGKLWMFGLGALVVAGAGMGLGVFLGKRSRT